MQEIRYSALFQLNLYFAAKNFKKVKSKSGLRNIDNNTSRITGNKK